MFKALTGRGDDCPLRGDEYGCALPSSIADHSSQYHGRPSAAIVNHEFVHTSMLHKNALVLPCCQLGLFKQYWLRSACT